jgi:hypothetical protein
MPSSRARSRFAALAAAVPLLVAAGPFVAPAFAAGGITVSSPTDPGQVLGPHAGYLGAGIGQNGTTEVFRVSVPDGTTLNGVTVMLTGDSTQISLGRDFDSGDGFALYANTDGQPGLSAADKQKGLVSTGWSAGTTESDGDTPIAIALAAPVTGATEYYVTAHPAARSYPTIRQFTLRMDPNAVTGSDTGPTSAVSTPTDSRLRIDSVAPGAPAKANFAPLSRTAGTEDSYNVKREASTEPGLKVAFYNIGTDTAESALLVRQDATKAVDMLLPSDPTAAAHEISIGDGTGITSSVPVAKNNQRNNSVYVRLIDTVGNFSDPTALLMTSTDSDTTPRGNVVVAPAKPTSVVLDRINGVNQNAANVTVKGAANPAAAGETTSVATKMTARIVQLGADTKPDFTKTTPTETRDFSSAATGVAIPIDTRPIAGPPAFTGIAEGASAVGIATIYDAYGNVADPVTSSPQMKDTVNPVLAAVEATAAGQASPGQLVRLQFSEPMDKTKIAENTGDSDCTQVTGGVQDRLIVKTTGGATRSWGKTACFHWNTDGSGATVRVGATTTGPSDSCSLPPTPTCPVLFSTGDLVTPAGSLSVPVVSDVAGNQLRGLSASTGQVGTTSIGTAVAFPLSATTNDTDKNGRLDSVDVTFSAPVNNAGFATYGPNLSIVGSTTLPVDSATYPTADHAVVRFSFGGGLGTGERPFVRLARPDEGDSTGLMTQEGTPREVLPFSVQPTDTAAPRPISQTYADTNSDGHIDQVVITYSEPIDHAKDNNAGGTLTQGGYKVPGYEVTPSSPASSTPDHNAALPTSGTTATTTLALKPSAAFDTGSLSVTVSFTGISGTNSPYCSGSPCMQFDAAGNAGDLTWSRPVADGAPPALLTKTTRDLDNDGKIDAIDIAFSEALSTPSLGLARFAVTGHQILEQFGVGANGDTIRLLIDEAGDRGTGDTDAKPTVTYQGGVADTQGNTTPAEGATPKATTDGAGPAIVAACPLSPAPNNGICPAGDDGTKLLVVMSEPLSAVPTQTTFTVEQPLGTVKAQNAAPVSSGTTANKAFLLSFAAGATAIDETQDAYVKLSADQVVQDAAANKSHQTSPVTAFALPSVTLAITCPTVANPGTCTSATINTGATGTSGVNKWRLAQTPRGTTPADSEFTTTQPSTLTLAEGTYTLYLSGKDDYGRLSPEVSQTVKIVFTPQFLNGSVKFLDVTSRPSSASVPRWPTTDTLVDGDNFQVSANVASSDVSEWKDANGNCKAANMWVDFRSTTRNGGLGNVAPFSCDIQSGESPYRALVSPFEKAAGTTRYPVGTVLRVSTSDPGFMVVDGPNGTLLRRQFVSVNARRSWQVPDALVITVPSSVRSGLNAGPNLGYRDGAVVHTSGSPNYYYVLSGERHWVARTTLAAWSIPLSTAYTVTTAEYNAMPAKPGYGPGAHPVGTWIKLSNGSIQQLVKIGGVTTRRGLAAAGALKTLVPASQVYTANSKDLTLPLDTFVRGYRDGTLLALSGNTFGVVSRGSLRRFANGATFNTLGYNGTNAIAANGGAMSHTIGQGYRNGATIDRYLISTLTINARNTAGGLATAIVLPAPLGGIYGVGTLDAVPDGWDPSWS